MQSIIKRLRKQGRHRFDITGLAGSSGQLLAARIRNQLNRPVCCLVPADEQLDVVARDTALFTDAPVLIYPSFEIPPYTALSPDPATTASRLSTLYQLQNSDQPPIVFASVEAVLRRVLPRRILNDHCELIISGEDTDRQQLISFLTTCGYESCDLVRRPGDMAVRGGIVDIFPPAAEGASLPLRLDFFGDTIESIRSFDPVTQRSKEELAEAVLLPATDLLYPDKIHRRQWLELLSRRLETFSWPQAEKDELHERLSTQVPFAGCEFFLPLLYLHTDKPAWLDQIDRPQQTKKIPSSGKGRPWGQGYPDTLETFFDYLPADSLLITIDPIGCKQKNRLIWERIRANYEEAIGGGKAALPPEQLFIPAEEQGDCAAPFSQLRFCGLPDPDSPAEILCPHCGDHSLLAQEIELQRKKRGLPAPLIDRLTDWSRRGETSIIACTSPRQRRHLEAIISGYSLETDQVSAPITDKAIAGKAIHLVEHPLSHGFDLDSEKIHFLSAAELFGEKRLGPGRKKTGKRQGRPIELDTLAPGDIVVHRDHGLGRFSGLVNMELGGRHSDFMLIEFRGGDKLYVPVDRLHWVSRYQGLGDREPRLDRLGSTRWQTTKKKVTEAVWKVAQELLDIHARRELRQGHSFSPPGELYRQLTDSFPYEETEGQERAITDVLGDMTGEQPMDRLICGDVGYGKTEVAVRAACKAIEDGFQVAILVPTTVLAEQHAKTFRERFAGFPVNIACLNRFRTQTQQRTIKTGLENGTIDLVIGTHRLLSGDIVYGNLGLLIVDEEHRFGVTHKEKIKKLKNNVDVLTLTATPIPRTLQMSLLGIRDLSVISTPPRRRQPVKTFLARREDLVIREAVHRELQRGGQLFFVHNRVRSITRVAEHLSHLVPEARIGIGHGQMAPARIEDVMVRFINHEIDVLVCTTIIESGLDISNANTIIINRADHFGLADIYQLRGRVGRCSRQSYAYLLVPSLDKLTGDAKKRLRALMDASELGSGFKLAMNDLQIRGGGNLLGVSQSGHIAAVGYDLYLDLLQETVEHLKKRHENGMEEPMPDPEVNLKITAFLPEDYIMNTGQRYHVYRRLSLAGNDEPAILADLKDEIEDRYGRLPPEALELWRMIGLKYPLAKLGITKLEQGPEALIYSFADSTPVEVETLLRLMKKDKKAAKKERRQQTIRLTPDQRLVVPLDPEKDIFQQIENVVALLSTPL